MAFRILKQKYIIIDHDTDITVACYHARLMAASFSEIEQTAIVIAILEVGRNIIKYARPGSVTLNLIDQEGHLGLEVIAEDSGPGIGDIDQAMVDGFSTGQSLGLGLPGAKRLMSEFEISSTIGLGTTVVMRKWTEHESR